MLSSFKFLCQAIWASPSGQLTSRKAVTASSCTFSSFERDCKTCFTVFSSSFMSCTHDQNQCVGSLEVQGALRSARKALKFSASVKGYDTFLDTICLVYRKRCTCFIS